MPDWLIWFLASVALLVAEMFTAGFWLACLAVGAFVAGVVALIPGLGLAPEGIPFALSRLARMAGPRAGPMPHLPPRPGPPLRPRLGALPRQSAVRNPRDGPGHHR